MKKSDKQDFINQVFKECNNQNDVKRDFLGNRLKVGDLVILTRPMYKSLTTGKVVKLNTKTATIKWFRTGVGWQKTPKHYDQIYKLIWNYN